MGSKTKQDKIEINLTPFLAVAAGIGGEKVWEAIDKIYKPKRFEFYNLAKQNEFYDNTLLTGGDIHLLVYGRRALGILLYMFQNQDKELAEEFIKALAKNKVFRKVITYAQSAEKLDVTAALRKIAPTPEKLPDDDTINSAIAVLFFTAIGLEKELVENEGLQEAQKALYGLQEMYRKNGSLVQSNFRNGKKKVLNKEIKKELFGNLGKEKDYRIWKKFMVEGNTALNAMSYIFDENQLSLSSVIRNIPLSGYDADVVVSALESAKGTEKTEDGIIYSKGNVPATKEDEDVLMLLFYIHVLLKAYRQVKEEFVKNNKETLYVELASLIQEKEDLEKRVKEKEREIEDLQKELKLRRDQTRRIQELEKEIYSLKGEIFKERQKNAELNALREFVFSLKTGKEEKKTEEEIAPIDVPGVFVGGFDGLFAKLKPYLPNFAFVSGEVNRFDENLLKNRSIVVIYPEVMSHALYYFTVDKAKEYGTDILFVSGRNIEKIIRNIKEAVK